MTTEIPSYRSPDAARDRLVALCGNVENLHVLDVGAGDGLIGRSLIPGVGARGSVTFVDRDPNAVENLSREFAGDSRIRAVIDDARELCTIDSDSIDLVVMRAVLLYVPDKRAALASAARVLRQDGRLVLSEPVNRPLYDPPERFWGFDLSSIPHIAARLQRGFTESPDPAVRAMMDWDDLDLASAVIECGFSNAKMETYTEFAAGPVVPWLAFLHARWTPWLPSLAQMIREHLTAGETEHFERVVRPQLAGGQQRMPFRTTFITATLG